MSPSREQSVHSTLQRVGLKNPIVRASQRVSVYVEKRNRGVGTGVREKTCRIIPAFQEAGTRCAVLTNNSQALRPASPICVCPYENRVLVKNWARSV